VRTFHGIDDLEKAVGTHLGHSEWTTVTQQQINLFAEATGDHQWIHTDPARAAEGPFGGTVAHGYLTLSLVTMLVGRTVQLNGLRMGVNYGSNKVRYPAPLPSGSRVRAATELLELKRGSHGAQATFRVTVEREGGDKPVCVAEIISLLVD
jgi:acyl dehydratase